MEFKSTVVNEAEDFGVSGLKVPPSEGVTASAFTWFAEFSSAYIIKDAITGDKRLLAVFKAVAELQALLFINFTINNYDQHLQCVNVYRCAMIHPHPGSQQRSRRDPCEEYSTRKTVAVGSSQSA